MTDSFYLNLTVNVLVHMIILFCILSGLFWFIVSSISSETLTKEINQNINSAIDNMKIPREEIRLIVRQNKFVFDTIEKHYDNPDPQMKLNNDWLKVVNITSIAVLVITLIVLLFAVSFSCSIDIPIFDILKENIVLFICIGIVEFLFFTNIAMYYVPIKPSEIVATFIDKLNSNLNLK